MPSGIYRFERCSLDPVGHQLKCDDAAVELNSRYLDALALLVREQGKLVSKERFLDAVWKGVPVTDEALTQCIRMLRKQLDDDARFIETVPKHGSRFIAPVTEFLLLSVAGSIGGGVAGMFGGLFYSTFATAQPLETGIGATSMLLVLICITVFIGGIGSAGVSLGIAAARFARGRVALWTIIGGRGAARWSRRHRRRARKQ
jgi:DNA-binding winged helix-turn-helix (wHTH) protein